MPLAIVTSDRFADHLTPPGHPERPERAEVMQVVATRFRAAGGEVLEPRAATDEDLARVHTGEYLARLASVRGTAAMLDPDTFTSPESEAVARLAAGAVLTAIDWVKTQAGPARALAMVRPPGHHAEAGKAMGFCLFNNVAVGAAYARASGVARVAIVDYDVHHGNGTQWTFYEDPTVLFASTHQYPYYPGTGASGETGRGPGMGFTVNVPLEVGATDRDVEDAYARIVLPRVRAFEPRLIIVSAGFDAHESDPLGQLRMTTAGYGRLTKAIVDLADDVCAGRVVFVTEGGYDLHAFAECLQVVIDIARN